MILLVTCVLVILSELRGLFLAPTRRIEVDDNRIYFFDRGDEPREECYFKDIVTMQYRSFFGWRYEFIVRSKHYNQFIFPWSIVGRMELIELLESKSGLKFEWTGTGEAAIYLKGSKRKS